MFPFIAQHEEVKRSRKTAVRKTKNLPKAKPTNNQGSRETGQVSILHLTLELPTCAVCMELRVFRWSSRSLGSETVDQMHGACVLLSKVSNKLNSTIFG